MQYAKLDVEELKQYLDEIDKKDNILEGLGIIGWESYERAIEAFLLIGGSILLVGTHGASKSRLAKRLGEALGVSMAKYDASKSVWEDIIGFPDPAKLMNLEYRKENSGLPRIETPTSIWNKRLLLVDEINRSSAELQSKWLEVILDQTVMGESTGTKWILSAMNPGYAGTNPLDLALVSRYMFFIQAPLGVKMSNEELLNIMELENPDEYPALMTWKEGVAEKSDTSSVPSVKVSDDMLSVSQKSIDKFVETSNKLKAILIVAADSYEEVNSRWSNSVNEYVISVAKHLLNEAKFSTDLRRVRMIKNAIIASIALEVPVKGVTPDSISSSAIQSLALQILYMSYPTIALIDGPSREQLHMAHMASVDLLEDRSSPLYKIFQEVNPITKLGLLFNYEDRDPILTYKVLNEVLDNTQGNIAYNVAYSLLDAYRHGLDLDMQAVTIICGRITELLDNSHTHIERSISNWNKLKPLPGKTAIEVYACKVAMGLAYKKLEKSNEYSKYMSELNETYTRVLESITSIHDQLFDMLHIDKNYKEEKNE